MQNNLKNVVLFCLCLIPFVAWYVADGRLFDLPVDMGSSGLFFPFISGKNFAFRVLVEIAFVAWAFLAIRYPEYRPRVSKLLIAYSSFIVILFVADLFGINPAKSFFSNYERMEGFVTHLHLYAYFVMFVSVVKTSVEWDRVLKIFLGSNALVLLWAYLQLLGSSKFFFSQIAPGISGAISKLFPIHMSDFRLDSTIGNSAYFAIYAAIFAFIAAILYTREQDKAWKKVYVVMIVLNLIALYYSGTRGTQLGIGVGLLVMLGAYIFSSFIRYKVLTALAVVLPFVGVISMLINPSFLNYLYQGATAYIIFIAASAYYVARKEGSREKKIASVALIGLAALALSFTLLKDTPLVRNSPSLARLASISYNDITTFSRFTIWKMSYEGWKDRPLLGYGQDNFSYVFAKYYEPSMYSQEPWFDRSHNVFFDWLVAGGILGLLAYLSLFVVALYLIFRVRGDLSKMEKALLLGMLVTYFIHNLLVFDNLTSYILFFMMLAFISGRTEGHLPRAPHKNVSEYQAVLEPVVVVAVLVVFWFAVYKPYSANTLLIKGIDVTRLSQTLPLPQMIENQIDSFKKALELESFGSQEIREQVLTYGARLAAFNPGYSDQAQAQSYQQAVQKFHAFADEMIAQMDERDQNDVRQLSIIGGYMNARQDFVKAEQALAKSYELSPKKQRITFEYINALIRLNKTQEAYNIALETYLYEPKFTDAAIILAAAPVYVGKEAEAQKVFADTGRQFPLSVEVVNAYINIGNFTRALQLLNDFKAQNPSQAAAVDAFIEQMYSQQKK